MKTSMKWILGIVIAVVLIGLIGSVGFFAFNLFGGSGWMMGSRYGPLWDNGSGAPMGQYRSMPMHPYQGVYGLWAGGFSLLRFLIIPLLCLGFLILLGLGIVLLIRSQQQPKQTVVAPVSATEPVVTPVQVSDPSAAPPDKPTTQACPNCGQPVQENWSHCPYCGAPQAAV